MVEHLSFEEVALELNCTTSKVRQLILYDKQLKATRFTINGIELNATPIDINSPYDIGIGDQLSDEGKITSNIYEIGKTGITKVVHCGNLYIKRCDLDTFIAASGRDMSAVLISSNNLAATIEVGSSTLSKKERETLLKLVIGMAVKGYRYDPAALKNSATKDIVDDLVELGIGIDPDTVRKYLKEAERAVLPTKPRQS